MIFFRILPTLALLLSFAFSLNGQERPMAHVVQGLKHVGGIHFYAPPGVLIVSLFKKDDIGNSINQTMHAILTGPDGSRLDSAKLYKDSRKTLRANIQKGGVYTLFVSMNADQYNRSVTWGFETNAEKFMINTGTGHTDGNRSEPIILNGSNQPFSVFFKPSMETFKITANGLLHNGDSLLLYNSNGKLAQKIDIEKNKAEATIQTGNTDGIWELRLPQQKGVINIEGVTMNWKNTDNILPVWSINRDVYFDVENYHWLLSPRRFARNIKPGSEGSINFTLFNNSKEDMPVDIQLLDHPKIGKLSLSSKSLTLAPDSKTNVKLEYKLKHSVAKGTYDINVLVKDRRNNKQAFSLFQLRVDSTKAVRLPIQLKLFEHNQFHYAYEPDYPRDNQFYFDADNRPWLVSQDGLKVRTDKGWETIVIDDRLGKAAYPTSTIGTDKDGFVYTIVNIGDLPYLMRVNAKNTKPQLAALPQGGSYKMETFMGGRVSDHPPAIVRYLRDAKKRRVSKWAKIHRLELLLSFTHNGKLGIGDPILISDNCVGTSDHSGITNTIASDGDQLHIIWGETSETDSKDPGVPTYIASYNRKTERLSESNFLAYSPPVNDAHNMSSILVDSEGTKHAIIGAHGRPFQYLKQHIANKQWSVVKAISQLGQTYVGAVLDAKDGIHLFCRTWRNGKDFPGVFDASLYFQHMQGKSHTWKEQKPFVLPALPGYTIYYHRLTVDREGKLYLSMDYWPTWSPYRDSYLNSAKRTTTGKNRIVFTSEDGKNWEVL